MDLASAITVLEIQLKDVQDLLAEQKSKQRLGQMTDVEHALHVQADDIRASLTSLRDRTMAKSISRAVQDDFSALASEIANERQAERDRDAALKLNYGPQARNPVSNVPVVPHDLVIHRLAPLNAFKENEPHTLLGTNSQNKRRTPDHIEARCDCAVCFETKPASQFVNTPCNHLYCYACTWQLFHDAARDESLFPPRCCRQEIPLSSVRTILGTDLTQAVEVKGVEMRTTNRTYCSNVRCSKFIMPYDVVGMNGKCTACFTLTCTRCKETTHTGPCDEPQDREALAFTGNQGWRRCYHCRAVVELRTGCNHITCRCRAEFCYICGAKWKTCQCPQWDEARLIERAETRLGHVPAAVRQEAVAREAEHLREHHECDHGDWERIGLVVVNVALDSSVRSAMTPFLISSGNVKIVGSLLVIDVA